MLSKDLEITLNMAFKEARTKRHEYMTVEHLLLALLDNSSALEVLKGCSVDLAVLRKELDEFVNTTTPVIPEANAVVETQPTLGFQRVLQRAVFHVQSSGKKEVTGANVLVAIFSEQESQAVFLLKQQNISRIDVVNYIAHGISKVGENSEHEELGNEQVEADPVSDAPGQSPLENFATNLNEQATKGQIDPLIVRDSEVSRVIQILSRRGTHTPWQVGASGVGTK